MGDVAHSDPEQMRREAAVRAADAETTLVRAVHVWVQLNKSGDLVPGVLAEWVQDSRGWFGLVAFSAPWWDQRERRWKPRLSREWVHADRLKLEGVGLTSVPPDRMDGTPTGWGREGRAQRPGGSDV